VAQDLFEALSGQLRQGDIFEAVTFFWSEGTEAGSGPAGLISKSSAVPRRGMLLNQSCDVDKQNYHRLVVIPVLSLSVLSSSDQTNVRKNKVFSRLYLPSYRDLLPETFVSFLEPMTVAKSFLVPARRIVSLSEKGRRALYVQYTRWLTRWQLTEIECPNCGAAFNPTDTLHIVND